MGIISHHAIIVTANYGDFAEQAHRRAMSLFPPEQVSPLSPFVVNGTRSFCVFPDGSKEGWAESAEGDARRDSFINWLNEQRYGDGSTPYCWAEVEIGELGSPAGNSEGAAVRRHYMKGVRLGRYGGPAALDRIQRAELARLRAEHPAKPEGE